MHFAAVTCTKCGSCTKHPDLLRSVFDERIRNLFENQISNS